MAVTIHDVAREANVSITTVSRVINGNYPVRKETKENVKRVIKELGFIPNETARSLITKKTRRVGILVPNISNVFFSQIIEYIETLLLENGYSLIIHNTYGSPQREISILNHLGQQNVEGVLILDPCSENVKNNEYDLFISKMQMLLVGGMCIDNKYDFIAYDERKGFCDALQYLYGLGHRKIAFVRGQNSYSYDLKEAIYLDFLEKHNLNYNVVLRVKRGNRLSIVKDTERESLKLLAKTDAPTAIFTCNELMAAGVIRAIDFLKLKIPQNLSLVSCDNTLIGEITKPKLTTIDLKQKEVSEKSVHLLLSKIRGEKLKISQYTFNTSLVIRESCERIGAYEWK